jgi:hypothetical protein
MRFQISDFKLQIGKQQKTGNLESEIWNLEY